MFFGRRTGFLPYSLALRAWILSHVASRFTLIEKPLCGSLLFLFAQLWSVRDSDSSVSCEFCADGTGSRCATEMRDRRNNPQNEFVQRREPLLALMRRQRGNRDSLIREILLRS
jgi:hypothetical protein